MWTVVVVVVVREACFHMFLLFFLNFYGLGFLEVVYMTSVHIPLARTP